MRAPALEPGRPTTLRGGVRRLDLLVSLTVGCGVAAWTAAALGVALGALRPAASACAVAAGVAAALAASRAPHPPGEALTPGERLALAAFAAASLRQFGWLVYERAGVVLTLLSHNYGDLPLHWTYIRHMARGASFWPENPILIGSRLRYPLGVDLLGAVAVQLGGALEPVLQISGLLGAALGAFALRRWGGALAVAGFLCAGGLAGFRVFLSGRLVDYQSAVEWKSLFLSLLVPQRGFLLALPIGLLLLWSWRRRLLRGEPGLHSWVEGALWGALPLVHLHTFLFVSLLWLVWALAGGRWRLAIPGVALAVLPAAWATWQVTGGPGAASLIGWSPGWTIGQANPLAFLALNFGLFLPLACAALVVALRERRREHLAVLGPALAVFAALFLVRLAPWAWDNTKVMLWCYVAALPAIQELVLERLRPRWRAAAVFLFLFSGAESVVAASAGRVPRLDVLDRGEYEAVCAVLAPLGRDERVATAQVHNHPVALCGQPIVAGYAGHLWSHGLDARRVEATLARLMNGEGDYRAEGRDLGARYLFWGPRERVAFPRSTQPWQAETPLASGEWGALYRLTTTSASATSTTAPPASVHGPGVSPKARNASSEAPSGSPSRNRPTVGAGSERSDLLTSPWPPIVGTRASAANTSQVRPGKGASGTRKASASSASVSAAADQTPST